MEIKYIAHSCFEIKGKDATLVIDPYDPKKTYYELPKLNVDLVLSSHDHFDHNNINAVKDYKMAITTPGEYELNGVYIEGIPTLHDDKEGEKRGKNIMFQITMDGFNILHMGDLGHTLDQETLKKILDIDVLLIPVGGEYTIDAETAAEVISKIEPGLVVPMHYQGEEETKLSKDLDTLEKFLDEMGGDGDIKKVKKLKLSKSSIPDETEVVVITPTHQK